MGNLTEIFLWWLFFFFIGIITLPVSFLLFRKFTDCGYGLSKILGILAGSYITFVLSTIKAIPFNKFSIYVVFGLLAIFNLYVFFKNKKLLGKFFWKKISFIIIEEVLFVFGLILWTYIRAQQPAISGLEKLMDFGFVNSALRGSSLPPQDMWFAGKSINYYWYGHYVTAFVIKSIGTQAGVGYNLMLGTILGLSLSASFSLITSLIKNFQKRISKRQIIIGGFISAVLLNFAGNFHTPFYILKNGRDAYWYPDATRFIGYNPDVNDKTIHEFPIYSYVVADLHAHLLNLPFVLFFISLLYSFLTYGKRLKNNLLPILGMTLGIMFMTNAWDFANYLLASGFIFLFFFIKKRGFTFETVYKTALPLVIIILTAIFAVLPFVAHFESIAQGVQLTHTKTPVWQLAILWGFPAVMTAIFCWRMLVVKKKVKEDLFIISLLTAAWTLIIIPEFIYVKDIYAATHYRANTMFKLTYQAYVMFYLSTGYIVLRAITSFKKISQKFVLILFVSVVFASIMYYPFLAVKSYYGNLKSPPAELSGDTWLLTKYPDIYSVILWFRGNVPGQPVILEAPGDSYTDFNVISSYTGLPTVSGWYVHEWLWRGSPEFPQARVNDITQIYTGGDPNFTKSLLQKYGVEYVIIGDLEREKYPSLNEEKFLSLGNPVFTSGTTKVFLIKRD